jgi:hypothetical protein
LLAGLVFLGQYSLHAAPRTGIWGSLIANRRSDGSSTECEEAEEESHGVKE